MAVILSILREKGREGGRLRRERHGPSNREPRSNGSKGGLRVRCPPAALRAAGVPRRGWIQARWNRRLLVSALVGELPWPARGRPADSDQPQPLLHSTPFPSFLRVECCPVPSVTSVGLSSPDAIPHVWPERLEGLRDRLRHVGHGRVDRGRR